MKKFLLTGFLYLLFFIFFNINFVTKSFATATESYSIPNFICDVVYSTSADYRITSSTHSIAYGSSAIAIQIKETSPSIRVQGRNYDFEVRVFGAFIADTTTVTYADITGLFNLSSNRTVPIQVMNQSGIYTADRDTIEPIRSLQFEFRFKNPVQLDSSLEITKNRKYQVILQKRRLY